MMKQYPEVCGMRPTLQGSTNTNYNNSSMTQLSRDAVCHVKYVEGVSGERAIEKGTSVLMGDRSIYGSSAVLCSARRTRGGLTVHQCDALLDMSEGLGIAITSVGPQRQCNLLYTLW